MPLFWEAPIHWSPEMHECAHPRHKPTTAYTVSDVTSQRCTCVQRGKRPGRVACGVRESAAKEWGLLRFHAQTYQPR